MEPNLERDAGKRHVRVPVGSITLAGDLLIPPEAKTIVVFAHGSGSGRKSPRNRLVAKLLQQRPFATLLIDLLTEDEEQVDVVTAELRFDIDLLATRLEQSSRWLLAQPATRDLHVAYFGASTGAAAALVAAARQQDAVRAVVSRGGRPDLAGPSLSYVSAPTLLIVGGADEVVLELNRAAFSQLQCERDLVIIPGATHLFPEPGALERVADLTAHWLEAHQR